MKTNFKILILLALFIVTNIHYSISSEKPSNEVKLADSVEVVEQFSSFYKSGDFYFGGQPSLDAIKWLKSEGVLNIISLRSERENENFTEEAFNEESIAKEMGFNYKSVPVSYPDSYTPEKLDEFIQALSACNGKVFIHCASCGRVRLFFMAYLVKEKKYTLDQAYAFGKQMDFSFLLEDILGKEIKMKL